VDLEVVFTAYRPR